jgi:hypothetical protein
MTDMKTKTQKIWDAFCSELTQKPTDDMKEALATVIRKIAEPLYGDGVFTTDVEAEKFQIADDLNELADELEELK